MEKFAVDLDRVLDEFEYNEDCAEQVIHRVRKKYDVISPEAVSQYAQGENSRSNKEESQDLHSLRTPQTDYPIQIVNADSFISINTDPSSLDHEVKVRSLMESKTKLCSSKFQSVKPTNIKFGDTKNSLHSKLNVSGVFSCLDEYINTGNVALHLNKGGFNNMSANNDKVNANCDIVHSPVSHGLSHEVELENAENIGNKQPTFVEHLSRRYSSTMEHENVLLMNQQNNDAVAPKYFNPLSNGDNENQTSVSWEETKEPRASFRIPNNGNGNEETLLREECNNFWASLEMVKNGMDNLEHLVEQAENDDRFSARSKEMFDSDIDQNTQKKNSAHSSNKTIHSSLSSDLENHEEHFDQKISQESMPDAVNGISYSSVSIASETLHENNEDPLIICQGKTEECSQVLLPSRNLNPVISDIHCSDNSFLPPPSCCSSEGTPVITSITSISPSTCSISVSSIDSVPTVNTNDFPTFSTSDSTTDVDVDDGTTQSCLPPRHLSPPPFPALVIAVTSDDISASSFESSSELDSPAIPSSTDTASFPTLTPTSCANTDDIISCTEPVTTSTAVTTVAPVSTTISAPLADVVPIISSILTTAAVPPVPASTSAASVSVTSSSSTSFTAPPVGCTYVVSSAVASSCTTISNSTITTEHSDSGCNSSDASTPTAEAFLSDEEDPLNSSVAVSADTTNARICIAGNSSNPIASCADQNNSDTATTTSTCTFTTTAITTATSIASILPSTAVITSASTTFISVSGTAFPAATSRTDSAVSDSMRMAADSESTTSRGDNLVTFSTATASSVGYNTLQTISSECINSGDLSHVSTITSTRFSNPHPSVDRFNSDSLTNRSISIDQSLDRDGSSDVPSVVSVATPECTNTSDTATYVIPASKNSITSVISPISTTENLTSKLSVSKNSSPGFASSIKSLPESETTLTEAILRDSRSDSVSAEVTDGSLGMMHSNSEKITNKQNDEECSRKENNANAIKDSETETSPQRNIEDHNVDSCPEVVEKKTDGLNLDENNCASLTSSEDNTLSSPDTSESSSVEVPEACGIPSEVGKKPDEGDFPSEEESKLGRVPPFWVPDEQAPYCMFCCNKFTVLKRRHHCRACGKVFCSKCCCLKYRLEYLNSAEVRVCLLCHDILVRGAGRGRSSSKGSVDPSSTDNIGSGVGRQPNPNNPMEYCSTIPPLEQVANTLSQPVPSVLVPVGVLKREGRMKSDVAKQVMFSDGIRPGGDLTEEGGSSDGIVRQSDVLTKRANNSPGTAHAARLSRSYDSKAKMFISSNGIPPLAVLEKGNLKLDDAPFKDMSKFLVSLRCETTPPAVFALNQNLFLRVKILDLDCCVNRLCWCFSTVGMSCVGQDEIVIVLECIPKENSIPADIFQFLNSLYLDAAKGVLVTEMGHTIFKNSTFLGSSDHGGFLFIRPSFQCLHKIILPSAPYLVGILIHRWEIPWAKLFPIRLMLRLGAEFRYYPCMLVSVQQREPVYCEIGHTIMNLLADFRNMSYTLPSVPGMVIHMEDRHTSILLPKNRYDQVAKALNNSNDHVFALAANFSLDADSHLVCIQSLTDDSYHTQAINIHNKPRKVTGASFVVFNGALKISSNLMAKSTIVEDGLMVQITPDMIQELRASLHQMKDFSVHCGPTSASEPDEIVALKWVEEDLNFNVGVLSVIDGLALDGIPSIRVHNGSDFLGKTRLIRWTEVFIVQPGSLMSPEGMMGAHDSVDISSIAENLATATCMALCDFLDLLAQSGFTRIAVRANIHQDNVGYVVGSEGQKLPPIYMKTLDSTLVPVLHNTATIISNRSPLVLELLFHVMLQ